jgi:hypothetical protein
MIPELKWDANLLIYVAQPVQLPACNVERCAIKTAKPMEDQRLTNGEKSTN